MSKEETINYWVESAKRDREAATDLFKSGHYNWSLFLWQLVLEKLLKAKLISVDKDIVITHDLIHLSKLIGLELTKEQQLDFETISRFNIEARYEDYKQEFYKMATKDFAKGWIIKCEEYYRWLQKQI